MPDTLPDRIESACSEEALRYHLRAMIGGHGNEKVTAKGLALRWGLSQAYLSDVLNGRRGIAGRLAEAMGYERHVVFVPALRARKD